MGARFSKRIKIAPGIRVNVGLKGVSSVSVGRRGASVNVGKRGAHANIGTPIPGLSYRTKLSGGGNARLTKAQKEDLFREWAGVDLRLSLDDGGLIVVSDQTGAPAPAVVAKELVKSNIDSVVTWLEEQAREINLEPGLVAGIHLGTPRKSVEFEPQEFREPQPTQTRPAEPDLSPIELSVGQKLLHLLWPPAKRAWAENEALENERMLAGFELEKTEAAALHLSAMEVWEQRRTAFEEKEAERRGAWDLRETETTAMEQAFEERLQLISWPRETLIEFEFRGGVLLLDVDLPEVEDMPAKEASLRAGGKGLKYKKRAATTVRKEYMQHVHEIGLRLCGEAFALLPALRTVVLSGYSQRLDKATGKVNDDYLYSCRVSRAEWSAIDLGALERVDAVEAIAAWDLRRKVTKTGVFKPIEPFDA